MKLRYPALCMLFLATVLSCSPAVPSVPGASGDPATPPITPEYIPPTIPITATYEGCAYVWASKDMPELSREFNAELQAIGKDATGMAYAYGENCVYADGHSTFGAMETDFRVGVNMKNVHDEAALGDWMEKVMQVVLAIPRSQLQGPQPGRVDFTFKQPDPVLVVVSVPIDKYRDEAQGLHGADLFHYFHPGP
ncbi:MAG TPA: hypothetical protein VMJ64_17475 [Anaerolineales bacterium]|nr:hypothetical protein [Anaerolineales bacterium]